MLALRGKLQTKQQKEKKARNCMQYGPDANSSKKHFKNTSQAASNFNGENFLIVTTGYLSHMPKEALKLLYELGKLVGPSSEKKFKLIKWEEG